jgi:hypothetical protein
MTYEDCLKERDRLTISATLQNPQMSYLNFSNVKVAGQGSVYLHHNYSHYTKLQLPECSLEEELDNVRLSHYLFIILLFNIVVYLTRVYYSKHRFYFFLNNFY